MARITEVAVHAYVTAPGKPTHAAASVGDLFSALVGDAATAGASGAVVDQTGLAGKLTTGDGTSAAEPHQPAQKTDAAAALLAALPNTDPVTTPTVSPSSLPQADAKEALVAAPAATLLGADKPASKAAGDKSPTNGGDAATPNAADSIIQAQTTPVAVVVPVVVDGPKTAPAGNHPTDLLDASTRQQPSGVATLKADGSTNTPGQTGINPSPAAGSSSDVSAGSEANAGSKGDQATSVAIAAKTINQSAAQSVISNDPGSVTAGLQDQISAKSKLGTSATKGSNGKSASDAAVASDAKAVGTTPPQSSDGSSKEGKPVDGAVADAVKATPALKPDAGVKSAPQQVSATASNDASTQASTLLNQVQTTVTPVQAQLVAVRATSDAAVPVDGLAVEIAARAKSGKTRFDIRLDPPELGRIDVRLDIDSQGKVTSHLVVDKSETLDLLRRDAPQLQQALSDSGFKTGDGGMQFSLRDQSFTGRNDQGGQEQQRAVPLLISEDDTVPAVVAGRSYRMAGAASGIDITI